MLDCRACGACCVGDGGRFVVVGDDDAPSLPRVRNAEHDARLYLPTLSDGRCVYLRGQVGQPGLECSAYDRRPLACSAFEAGGKSCLSVREARGIGDR